MRSQSIIPRAGLLGISAIALMVGFMASPALAASCPLVGPQVAGIEQSMVVDAACIDPYYNETTFKLDKAEQKTLVLPDGATIPYTEVTGHFPATQGPNYPSALHKALRRHPTGSLGGFPTRRIGATGSSSRPTRSHSTF